jgi:hypothetical protein
MEPIHRSETKAALDFVPVDLDRGERAERGGQHIEDTLEESANRTRSLEKI